MVNECFWLNEVGSRDDSNQQVCNQVNSAYHQKVACKHDSHIVYWLHCCWWRYLQVNFAASKLLDYSGSEVLINVWVELLRFDVHQLHQSAESAFKIIFYEIQRVPYDNINIFKCKRVLRDMCKVAEDHMQYCWAVVSAHLCVVSTEFVKQRRFLCFFMRCNKTIGRSDFGHSTNISWKFNQCAQLNWSSSNYPIKISLVEWRPNMALINNVGTVK